LLSVSSTIEAQKKGHPKVPKLVRGETPVGHEKPTEQFQYIDHLNDCQALIYIFFQGMLIRLI